MLLEVVGFVVMIVVAAAAFYGGMCFGASRAEEENADKREADDILRAQDALSRIRDVATCVAADVDAHSNRVQEINKELIDADGGEAEVVVEAISNLIASNQSMQEQLHSAEEKLQKQAIELETHAQEARTDALTALPNRRVLDDELDRSIRRFAEEGRGASLMMVDIDHFKAINDLHGHPVGDRVLCDVAQVLKRVLPEPAIAARYGGEEFAVVVSGQSAADAAQSADRVRREIESAPFDVDGQQITITVSVGVAELQAGDNEASLVQRSDAALYRSKETGRNRVHWHDGTSIHAVARQSDSQPQAPPQDRSAAQQQPQPVEEQSLSPRAAETSGDAAPDSQTPAETPGETPPTEARPMRPLVGRTPEELGALARLSNRESFEGDVRRRVAEWGRGGAQVCVVLTRVDQYQQIVDEHGLDRGESALKACTQFIHSAMRDLDLVARWDHDCFAMLLPGAGLDRATEVAARLLQTTERCQEKATSEHPYFTISIGVSSAAADDNTETLLDRCAETLDAASADEQHRCFVHNGIQCEPLRAESAEPAAAT